MRTLVRNFKASKNWSGFGHGLIMSELREIRKQLSGQSKHHLLCKRCTAMASATECARCRSLYGKGERLSDFVEAKNWFLMHSKINNHQLQQNLQDRPVDGDYLQT